MEDHPIREALLALLADGPVTANQAARELGESSGSCSFHLRQLARAGLVEEAPVAPGSGSGRRRPWRLRDAETSRLRGAEPEQTPRLRDTEPELTPRLRDAEPELTPLLRELEDEGYRRWLAGRDTVDPRWHADEAASHVLWLTPAEMAEVAAAVRAVAERFAAREHPDARPPDARPVALVSRVFPLVAPTDFPEQPS
ncbi:winged helix-turn-helix domain-containing protein [Cryptosporangium sp. NPDC048952]|uniref:winged helix-turn-helix domain-containing protein n=1 Tax=Cryptosporangium sp. NPDC048952 TaxID=3363961 RepID=UPI003723ECC5